MANEEQALPALETVIFVKDEDNYATPSRLIARGKRPKTRRRSLYPVKNLKNPRPKSDARFCDGLYQVFSTVYAAWIELLQVKFPDKKQPPFFSNVSAIALCITILVLWILFYTKNSLKYPEVVRKMLTSIAWFSGILAHISLLVLLLIPPKLEWIGYVIISGLFVVMIAYTFYAHMMSLVKKMSSIWKRIKEFKENKTSSQSTRTIHV